MRLLALLLIVALAAIAPAADKAAAGPEPWAVTPSANAGKMGTYQASTRYDGCNYHVYVHLLR